MPRARTCGSAKTSARSLIGPHGTFAASSAPSQSARVAALQHRGQQRDEGGAVAHAVGVAGEARVARELGAAGDVAEPRELGVVADGQDHVPVGHLEDLVRDDVLVRVAGALRARRRVAR